MKKTKKRKQLAQIVKELFLGIQSTFLDKEVSSFLEERKERDSYIRSEEERYSLSNNQIRNSDNKRSGFYEKALMAYVLFSIIFVVIISLNPNIINILSSNINKFISSVSHPFQEWEKIQQDPQTSQKEKFSASLEVSNTKSIR